MPTEMPFLLKEGALFVKSSGKQKICEAFLALADHKSCEQVTVSDIIAAAGVNRTTFYYHFESTQAVLEYMMDSFCRSYLASLMMPSGMTAKELTGEPQKELENAVCSYIQESGKQVLFFLQDQNYPLFCRKFRAHFLDYVRSHKIVQVFPDGHTEPLKKGIFYDYYIHITCQQLFAVLECWAERGFSETEEDFIQIFDKLHNSVITMQG